MFTQLIPFVPDRSDILPNHLFRCTAMSLRQSTPDRLAFGENSFDGCPCPATATGENPDNNDVIHVAELYDDYLSSEDKQVGIVDESTAKDAWLGAIRELENRAENATDPLESKMLEQYAEHGRKVAKHIGWINI